MIKLIFAILLAVITIYRMILLIKQYRKERINKNMMLGNLGMLFLVLILSIYWLVKSLKELNII